MIDDKKIEEAAQGAADLYEQDLPIMSYNEDTEVDGQHHFCQEFGAELFKDGAKWAINEFLKDLWHTASEEPKKVKNLLLETTYEYGKPIYHLIKYMPNGNNVCAWKEWYKGAHISRWFYIDDLLPKEGGEQ